jgi:hypothetical protein
MAGSFVFVKPKLLVRIGQLLLYIGGQYVVYESKREEGPIGSLPNLWG